MGVSAAGAGRGVGPVNRAVGVRCSSSACVRVWWVPVMLCSGAVAGFDGLTVENNGSTAATCGGLQAGIMRLGGAVLWQAGIASSGQR